MFYVYICVFVCARRPIHSKHGFQVRLACRPVEREERGAVFSGPAAFGGPPSLKNTEKCVPGGLFLASNMYKIHFWLGKPRTPLGELTTLPQTSSGGNGKGTYTLPTFRRLRNKVVIGPRDNGFLGPAVALDGPSCLHKRTVGR